MNAADKAVANSLQFECKKNSLSQRQNGDWTVSFTVHAGDFPDALRTAVMGTRYQAVIVEIADDETPVEQPKPDKKEDKHKLSRQAAMLCGNPLFRAYLAEKVHIPGENEETDESWAANVIRAECGVHSRSQLDSEPDAAVCWQEMKSGFEGWRILP